MKLKRLLSGVTAAIMALSSVAIASFTTASAANDPIKPAAGWYGGDEGTLEGTQLKLIQNWSPDSKFPAIQNKKFYVAFEVKGASAGTTAFLSLSNGNDVNAWDPKEGMNPAISTPKDGKYVVSFDKNTSEVTQFLGVIFKKDGADDYGITSAKLIGCYLEDPSEELGIGSGGEDDPTPTPTSGIDIQLLDNLSAQIGTQTVTVDKDGQYELKVDGISLGVQSAFFLKSTQEVKGTVANENAVITVDEVTVNGKAATIPDVFKNASAYAWDAGKYIKFDIYNAWNADNSITLPAGVSTIQSISIKFTLKDVMAGTNPNPSKPDTSKPDTSKPDPIPGKTYDSFLMFGGNDWDSWGNWDTVSSGKGFGNDAVVSGDGTYTVSISADTINGEVTYDEANYVYQKTNPNNNTCFDYETGKTKPYVGGEPQVFCVDIIDLLKYYKETEVSCKVDSIKQDGKEIAFDPSKILYGNIEDDNDKYRIEIFNSQGDTKDDPAFNTSDLEFSDSLEVTYTIKMKKATVVKPPVTSSTNTTKTPTKATRNPKQVAKDKKAAQKAMKQAKLTSLKVKSKAKKKINVTWKKVKKAKGYQVQVSTNKKFKKSKIIFKKDLKKTKLNIKNKKIKSKKTYYVRVRAYATYKNVNNKTVKVFSKWNKKLRKVKVK